MDRMRWTPTSPLPQAYQDLQSEAAVVAAAVETIAIEADESSTLHPAVHG